jgi:quercetin dioxygenase-like cupin family protein
MRRWSHATWSRSNGQVTFQHGDVGPAAIAFAALSPSEQEAIWFLGAVVKVRAGGATTGGQLAVLEHLGQRGYGSPVHSHRQDEETFFVLEGELRVETGETTVTAGPGAVAFLPRCSPHGFVVASPQARFLTLHTPAGFEDFALAVGIALDDDGGGPAHDVSWDSAELTRRAAEYGIDILGPPLVP